MSKIKGKSSYGDSYNSLKYYLLFNKCVQLLFNGSLCLVKEDLQETKANMHRFLSRRVC